jgi:hypothetical protein
MNFLLGHKVFNLITSQNIKCKDVKKKLMLKTDQFKGTPLRVKSLKTLNLNFLHRTSGAPKTEIYTKDK